MQLIDLSQISKRKQLVPLLIAAALLSSCGVPGLKPEPEIVVQTEYVAKKIPLQEPPKPVSMPDVEWYVVNQDNLNEFLERVKADGGAVVFMAITPKGYENLSIGIGELRRYLLQQKEIIAYYEKAIQEPVESPPAE
jgi:hypothetical protein